jgi:hypothetical protein
VRGEATEEQPSTRGSGPAAGRREQVGRDRWTGLTDDGPDSGRGGSAKPDFGDDVSRPVGSIDPSRRTSQNQESRELRLRIPGLDASLAALSSDSRRSSRTEDPPRPSPLPDRRKGPKVRWKKNKGGLKRTIEEDVAIAGRSGVEVPEDVEFFEAGPGELEGSLKGFFAGQRFETARGPRVTEREDGRIYWQDHFNKDRKVPFRIHPDVLTSDEAIIAVFQHEMHELSLLRDVFRQSRTESMDATDYGLQTSAGRPANFHDLAWDEADKIILRMRRRGR